MKTIKTGYIVISVLLCLFGIMLVAVPGVSIYAIGIISGALLVIFGIVRLVGYFSKDLYRLAFQYDLALGIMMLALGGVMLWRPDSLMEFFCAVVGISFLADGLFKIQIAIDSKRFGISKWWLILALAVSTVLLGVLLVICPGESGRFIVSLIGISMLCEGVMNISTMLTAVRYMKKNRPKVIDVDYFDERKY